MAQASTTSTFCHISKGGGGSTHISHFDTLSLDGVVIRKRAGQGTERWRGTQIVQKCRRRLPFDFTLTGTDFDGDAATGTIPIVVATAADPIVLDLDHNGISFSSLENGVSFDINHDGAADQLAWTANGQDGILALDLDHSGKIESGNELLPPFNVQ